MLDFFKKINERFDEMLFSDSKTFDAIVVAIIVIGFMIVIVTNIIALVMGSAL